MPRTFWELSGARNKYSVTAGPRHFWKISQSILAVGQWIFQQSGTVDRADFFPPNSTFLWGIPIDFSASTQAVSWCSCTVLYQPNMCPHCPADLYTFEGRTALHSCFVQSMGWFVCLLFHYEKDGLLASNKMKGKKPEENNSPEIKSPKVLEIVNSKKCGGCKNHKLSFASIYSIYVCCEQCSMVRVGSPVSAASHSRHASHSWAQQSPLPTDTPKKPLSAPHRTGQDFASSLQSLSSRMEVGFAPAAEGTSPAVCEQVTGCSAAFCAAVIDGELRSHCQVQLRTGFGSVLAQITQS